LNRVAGRNANRSSCTHSPAESILPNPVTGLKRNASAAASDLVQAISSLKGDVATDAVERRDVASPQADVVSRQHFEIGRVQNKLELVMIIVDDRISRGVEFAAPESRVSSNNKIANNDMLVDKRIGTRQLKN